MPPVRASQLFLVSTSRGAAAVMHILRLLKSILPDLTSGWFMSAMKRVATPGKKVGRVFLKVVSRSLISRGLGISTMGTGGFTMVEISIQLPAPWNMGISKTALSTQPFIMGEVQARICMAFMTMPRCECITPLGVPVVPPLKRISAVSWGPTEMGGSGAPAYFRRISWNQRSPGCSSILWPCFFSIKRVNMARMNGLRYSLMRGGYDPLHICLRLYFLTWL